MPRKNVVKNYAPDNHYHVYGRGIDKRVTFLDDRDFRVFLSLLKQYLSPEDSQDKYGRPIKSLHGAVELNAFCLMPNHFHLLIYQFDQKGMQRLLQRLMTSYVMYFNKRHKRNGNLFYGSYRAVNIGTDEQLMHISGYIHLNPENTCRAEEYPYSSYEYFSGKKNAQWIQPERVLGNFGSFRQYTKYLQAVRNKRQQDALDLQNLDEKNKQPE